MRVFGLGSLAILGVLAAAAPAQAGLPSCAGPVEAEGMPVVRVEQNGVLVFKDGRAAVLEGIRLPHGQADRAPAALADEAIDGLRAAVVGKRVTLAVMVPKEDRYDRIRAQIADGDGRWIQAVMLDQGLARVAIAPDRTECASELLGAERGARAAGRGLWGATAYAVRSPDNVRRDVGTFQVVEGKVLSADVKGGRAYLNFGADWKSDFTVTVAPDDMAAFRNDDVDPRGYAGKKVRVRGFVEWHNGPEIETANPQDIEVLK